MRAVKLVLILSLAGLLTACGFKLRGSAELPGYKLPFATIALGLDPTTEFHALLKRSIEAQSPGTRVVADATEAEAVLSVLGDRSEKNILSLTAAGRAREYQLVRTFSFRVHGGLQPQRCRFPSTAMCRHPARPNTFRLAPSPCAAKSPSVTTWSCPRNRKRPCCCATCRATWCSN
jgi:outer membrane lipopolysaccharide assembly protein LptE/RlpB